MIEPLDDNQNALSAMSTIIAQNREWLSELDAASKQERSLRTDALGFYGTKAGLFVVRDGQERVFLQTIELHLRSDGHIVDGRNRQVLGFLSDGSQPRPLFVPPVLGTQFARLELDDRGVLRGIRSNENAASNPERVELGRLCLAIFPAPQKLAAITDGELGATAAAGVPRLVPSDASNIPALESQPSSMRLAQIRESAKQMWFASAHAEIDVALATSKDQLVRIALDLVK